MMIKIGCIADDFTGASDAASFLKKGGLTTILCNGVPREQDIDVEGCDAIVVALKTRSVEKESAVRKSLEALEFLKKIGAGQIYFKYCSTFDSTPAGNIGPVADSIMESLGCKYTLLCPALPVNRRIVNNGRLFVDGIPLDQGHMRNHPLNPMWDSYIANLMAPQSPYPCKIVDFRLLNNPKLLQDRIDEWCSEHEHFYLIPDYAEDKDGEKIAEFFGEYPFLTGGSGLLEHLAHHWEKDKNDGKIFPNAVSGAAIGLCGSCSKATGEQISHYKSVGGKYICVDPQLILSGKQSIESIWQTVSHSDTEVLVYSIGAEIPPVKTGDPDVDLRSSKVVEDVMSELGKLAYASGYTRIIVGGGETSGAVIEALGLNSFYIGESIAPGVPIMIPTSQTEMRIALKSGNFGESDFFVKAFDMTKG